MSPVGTDLCVCPGVWARRGPNGTIIQKFPLVNIRVHSWIDQKWAKMEPNGTIIKKLYLRAPSCPSWINPPNGPKWNQMEPLSKNSKFTAIGGLIAAGAPGNRLICKAADGPRHGIRHFRRQQTRIAPAAGYRLCRQSMQVHPAAGRVEGFHALGQQAADDSR